MWTSSADIQKPSGHAIVVGLGRSGVACATFLLNSGWDVEVGDVRRHPQMEDLFHAALPGIAIHSPLDPDIFMSTDLVAISSTVTKVNSGIGKLAEEYGAEVISGLELFLTHSDRPIVAIAGTNGKSTVASLLEKIISGHKATTLLGGCRGFTFAELLNKQKPDVYVLELSPHHLEQAQIIPADVSAVLNIAPDHIDRYGNVETYTEVLSITYNGALTSVVNRDDAVVSELPVSGESVSFGLDEPPRDIDFGITDNENGRWICRGKERLINLARCALEGSHNELNLLAACALAQSIGYPVDSVKGIIMKFDGLPYRCVEEGIWDGIRWINDARSTNAGAMVAAIESQSSPVVLICGGISHAADFSEISKKVGDRIRGCVVYGRDRHEIAKSLNGISKTEKAENLQHAVAVASQLAQTDDCVVFSPGCASFDMFTDYEHRGRSFSNILHGAV